MPPSKTISRNRMFSPAPAAATISAKVTGSGFTVVAFLDRQLEDVKAWPEDKLRSPKGISRQITVRDTHVLEFIVAFKSPGESTADISCQLVGADTVSQSRSMSVNGSNQTIARVSFHAPLE